MAEFDVLVPVEGIAKISGDIESRVNLHRLWQAPDREAALTRLAPTVKAVIATSHHAVVDAALMRRLPNLQIVASFGVGYDHIDAAFAHERGVIVTHTPGVLDDEVADIAMALTIATVRELPQAERYLREGRWPGGAYRLTASLRGRTMGILGLGRIGKAIARRAAAFGLDVVYHGRHQQVAAPGGAGTRHIVNREIIEAVGPEGIIVNVSRGSLIDETALIEALKDRKLLGAGLDVFEHEPNVPEALLALDNAVLLPHVGSASVHTRQAMADLMIDNLKSWLDGKGPLTPVPETPWKR